MLTATTAADAHRPLGAAVPARPAGPRVLVFRSCRLPQFTRTLAWIRAQWPAASIDAVSSPGYDEMLRASGVSRTFHYHGRSLSLVRHARLVGRLRGEAFDHVVIPQANAVTVLHANLYRAAKAIGAGRFVVAAPDQPPVVFEPWAFGWMAVVASLGRVVDALDVPLLLMALVAAALRPRPSRRPVDGRRRVLHVITSFGVGGAQVQLAELLGRTPPDRYDVHVLVLGRQDGDFSRQWLTRDDITFHEASGWPHRSLAVLDVARLCRANAFDIVHTWLFMANVIGAAGARLGGVPRVIGSVRNLSVWKRTWYAQWWFRAADVLATRIADVVTVNASALVADHAAWARYPASRLVVVPNGLDPARVRGHGHGARAWLREALGLPVDAVLVGTVGRLAPEKDHQMFIRAMARVCRVRADVHAVVVGDGTLRQALEREVAAQGLAGRLHLLGERRDSRRIIAGLDVFVLPSQIEGFPNVLLEAAFLGVPAVATRVGGAPDLLTAHDLVEPGDADGTSHRVLGMLERPDDARRRASATERRALDQFTAEVASAQWLALYDRLLSEKGDRP